MSKEWYVSSFTSVRNYPADHHLQDDALFPHHLDAECTARILGLLDSRSLLSLTLVSRSTRLVALPALLYRVNLHDDVVLENPKLLSFRTFVCDHSLGHHVRYFSYTFDGDIIHPYSTMADTDWMRALADIFQVCRRLVSLTLGQVCEEFFVHDPRLAPALLSLHSLVELRLYGIADVGLHAIRQIHGLCHLTLSADLYSDPVHSLDVSYIMLSLADVLEELVLRDIIPSWHALWEHSATAGIVCRNVKKLIILPSRSPSPRYLAHVFPDVRFLWIDESCDVDEELSDELSSSSSSQLWPMLTAVKSHISMVTKLASHCPSLQSIIAFTENPPSIPDVLTFLDAIPLNRIISISFPLSLNSTSDFVWRSAYQITPILAKLSVDATKLQFLSLSIHVDRWSGDSTQDVLKLVGSILFLNFGSSKQWNCTLLRSHIYTSSSSHISMTLDTYS